MGKDWLKAISQPRYRVRAERELRVTMRDGVKVAADLYLPDVKGRFPALLAMSPYGKYIHRPEAPLLPLSMARGNGGQEAGDSEYFVSRGYVHVVADVRGSGDSEGEYCSYGMAEQQDGYDLVEWIASQPWCDGNVGMLGMSYFAVNQYLVAALNPPHLKAIFACEGYTDRYRHLVYHGGILTLGFFLQWWQHVSVGATAPSCRRYYSEKEIEKRVEELKESREVKDNPILSVLLKHREKNPLVFDYLLQPNDGPYYWERSAYNKLDKIKVPCYLGTRWSGWPIHLPGAFDAYRRINAPKKMLIFETESVYGPHRPWRDHHDLILRWYDHWLKGIDTGMMEEPPIKILVKGSNEWRCEQEWPLARTQWTKLYLRGDAGLAQERPGKGEEPASFVNQPSLRPSQVVPSLRYRTAPLGEEMEVTGPVALYLQASLDTEDATWIVSISDVASDGTTKLVTRGWLRASHRALDPDRSLPYQPYHPHLEREVLKRGEVYEFAIEIRETSYLFLSGHRMELEIRGQDSSWEDPMWFHLCNPETTRHTIYNDPQHVSYLLLPIILKPRLQIAEQDKTV